MQRYNSDTGWTERDNGDLSGIPMASGVRLFLESGAMYEGSLLSALSQAGAHRIKEITEVHFREPRDCHGLDRVASGKVRVYGSAVCPMCDIVYSTYQQAGYRVKKIECDLVSLNRMAQIAIKLGLAGAYDHYLVLMTELQMREGSFPIVAQGLAVKEGHF